MNDPLEKYIAKNRDDFKSLESFDQDMVWRSIQSKKSNVSRPIFIYGIAATISLLVALAVSTYFISKSDNSDLQMLSSLESEYQALIDERLSYVRNSEVNNEITRELLLDVSELDQYKEEIIQDASTIGDQDKIVDLLRKYYEQKLRALELIEKEIQIQKHENEIIDL